MRDPTPTSGLAVLPLPSGDPAGLWRAADWLRVAAAHVEGTPLVATGALPAGVTDRWSGSAAREAGSEAAVLGSRSAGLADRLARAAAVLAEYGDALDAAQRTTAGLQTAYDDLPTRPTGPTGPTGPTAGTATPGGDPVGPADPTAMAVLTGRYVVAMAELDLAGGVAAHRLRALAAEAGGGPGGPGGQGGQGGPREAALAGLPMVAAALHRAEADRTADVVIDALVAVAGGDPWALGTAVALLDGWARDPVFAQCLWTRLSPDQLALVVAAVAAPPAGNGPGPVSPAWRQERGVAVVRGLGRALAVAANPAYGAALDPATAVSVDRWREDWLRSLAAQAGEVVRRPDGTTVGGAWVQGQLLAAAGAAGLSPGARYAATVGAAIVAADVRAGSGTGRGASPTPSATALLAPDGRSPAMAGQPADPVLALAEALVTDPAAARAWLLHPVPGAPGRMVVDHLVDRRYLDLDPAAGAASMAGVGRLVMAAGSDPTSRDATLVAAAYLGAVGSAARDSPHPAVFRRALAPALGEVGSLLGAHADAVTSTLDDSAGPGTDAAALPPAERLVRPGREPGSWEVVLADRATAAALVGELALDGHAAPTAGDPVSGPPLARVMGGIGATLEGDLAAAIATRANGGGSAEGIEAAARRLGSTTGFVLTSAGTALSLRAGDLDADNRHLADLADLAIGRVAVPGAAGRLATPLVRAAADQVVTASLPTGAQAAQRDASAAVLARSRDEALTTVRTLVSRSHPWTADQCPERWAARMATARSPVPFWDAAGLPLPEPEMTTAQRRSFTQWRRDEGLDVYDTVPQVVRDAMDAGVRDATAIPAPGPHG